MRCRENVSSVGEVGHVDQVWWRKGVTSEMCGM